MNNCLLTTILLFELSMACLFVRGDVCEARYKVPGVQINKAPPMYAYLHTVTDNLRECAMGCMYLTECKSVVFDQDSKHCQWFYEDTALMNGEFNVENVHGVFLEMRNWKQLFGGNPCAEKPCADQERCVPLLSSYICEAFDRHCNTLYFAEWYIGYIWDTALVSSSTLTTSVENILFLTGGTACVADQNDSSPYIEVQFTSAFRIRGILTRGNPELETWVTRYTVRTSNDCMFFSDIFVPGTNDIMMFEGNTDAYTSKINYFEEPFYAPCIRVMAQPFGNFVSMRMDVIGCFPINENTS